MAFLVLAAWLAVPFASAHGEPVPADVQARFAEGLAAYDGGDFRSALETWRVLAQGGHAEAQVALAGLYMDGQGAPVSTRDAIHWYRRAAQAGHPVAQLNLGDIYARGLGVPPDPVEAYAWLTLAARQGRVWAETRRQELAKIMTIAQMAEAEERLAHMP